MSDNSQIVVDLDATLEEAPQLAEVVRTWLVQEGIVMPEPTPDATLGEGPGYKPGPNYRQAVEDSKYDNTMPPPTGLEIEIGRRVFDAGGNGVELRCEACNHNFEPEPDWGDAVGLWFEGNDDATYACPECGKARRLTEWRGPFQWGFGNLGFQFWNWPPLSDKFISKLTEKLGHRTVRVFMHL